MILPRLIGHDSDRMRYPILSFGNHRFYFIFSFESEGHHDTVRLRVFIHFAEPRAGLYRITRMCQRFKIPKPLVIQRIRIFTSFEEHPGHLVEVVLQSVIVTREHTRPQRYLEHMPHKLGLIADLHTARTFKHLHICISSDDLNNLGHQLHTSDGDITDFILGNNPFNLHSH